MKMDLLKKSTTCSEEPGKHPVPVAKKHVKNSNKTKHALKMASSEVNTIIIFLLHDHVYLLPGSYN